MYFPALGQAANGGGSSNGTSTASDPDLLDRILQIADAASETWARLKEAEAKLKAAKTGGEASEAQSQINMLTQRLNQLESEKAALERQKGMPGWVLPVTLGVVGVGVLGLVTVLALRKPRRKRR